MSEEGSFFPTVPLLVPHTSIGTAATAFVRSFLVANFEHYISALSKMLPWFFSLDDTNYARRLSIHLRYMYRLKGVAPHVAVQFQQGKFAVSKTS